MVGLRCGLEMTHSLCERTEEQAYRAQAATDADDSEPPSRSRVEQERDGRSEDVCAVNPSALAPQVRSKGFGLADKARGDRSDEREERASREVTCDSFTLIVIEEETIRGGQPPNDGFDCVAEIPNAPESAPSGEVNPDTTL